MVDGDEEKEDSATCGDGNDCGCGSKDDNGRGGVMGGVRRTLCK